MASSRTFLACLSFVVAVALGPIPASAVTVGPGGWYWPTGTTSTGGMSGWMACRHGSEWHLAQDFAAPVGSPVYALTDGVVYDAWATLDGYLPGGAMVVLYRQDDGTCFKALYGHIKSLRFRKGQAVKAGATLAVVCSSSTPHLHFGIHPGTAKPTDPQANVFRGHTYVKSATYGWTDPLAFLATHTPWVPPVPSQVTTPSLPAAIRAGRLARISAAVEPAHDARGSGLVLDRWRLDGDEWVAAGAVRMTARRPGDVASCLVRFSPGTWRVQARFTGDLDHLPSSSAVVVVTVR